MDSFRRRESWRGGRGVNFGQTLRFIRFRTAVRAHWLVVTGVRRTRWENPWWCLPVAWYCTRPRVSPSALGETNTNRRAFAFPSTWTPAVRTERRKPWKRPEIAFRYVPVVDCVPFRSVRRAVVGDRMVLSISAKIRKKRIWLGDGDYFTKQPDGCKNVYVVFNSTPLLSNKVDRVRLALTARLISYVSGGVGDDNSLVVRF